MRQEVYLEEIVGAIFVILDVWKSVMAEKADEAIWQECFSSLKFLYVRIDDTGHNHAGILGKDQGQF